MVDRHPSRDFLQCRRDQLVIGKNDDQRILRARNLAQHFRCFARGQHVEVIERCLDAGTEVDRIGLGERLAEHFIKGIGWILHHDADAHNPRRSAFEIAIYLKISCPYKHPTFLLRAYAATPVQYTIDGRRADAGCGRDVGEDGFLLHDRLLHDLI
jgi:hypothetical protein